MIYNNQNHENERQTDREGGKVGDICHALASVCIKGQRVMTDITSVCHANNNPL